MKILTKNNVVIYKFNDSDVVTLTESNIKAPGVVICDCNIFDTVLHTNVTNIPVDFIVHKYLYDGIWSYNDKYIEILTDAEKIVKLEAEVATLKVDKATLIAEKETIATELAALKVVPIEVSK